LKDRHTTIMSAIAGSAGIAGLAYAFKFRSTYKVIAKRISLN